MLILSTLVIGSCTSKNEKNNKENDFSNRGDSNIYNVKVDHIDHKFSTKEYSLLYIPQDSLRFLVADIVYFDHTNYDKHPYESVRKIVSKIFEKYTFVANQKSNYEESYRQKELRKIPVLGADTTYGVFIYSKSTSVPRDSMLLVSLYGGGWESIPYIIAVFEKNGDKLLFKGFLDKLFFASIGVCEFELMEKLVNGTYLLKELISHETGDTEISTTIFIYQWIPPFSLIKIYSNTLANNEEGDQEFKFETKLDTLNKCLFVDKLERKIIRNNTDKIQNNWHVTQTDTFNYNKIIKNKL